MALLVGILNWLTLFRRVNGGQTFPAEKTESNYAMTYRTICVELFSTLNIFLCFFPFSLPFPSLPSPEPLPFPGATLAKIFVTLVVREQKKIEKVRIYTLTLMTQGPQYGP